MIDTRTPHAPLTFTPHEDPDWDGARTRRFALRVPSGEWCHSSVTYRASDEFTYHRADFAYEGLLALLGGENWKLLDRIGFQLLADGVPVELAPGEIHATPDWVEYRYTCPLGTMAVAYRLLLSEPFLLTATYRWLEAPLTNAKLEILLKPVFDIRHMYYFSDPDGHQIGTLDARKLTVGCDRWVALSTDRDFSFHSERHVWDLLYRLGSGDRELSEGNVVFKRELFRGVEFGKIRCDFDRDLQVVISGGLSESDAKEALERGLGQVEELVAQQERRWADFTAHFPDLDTETQARFYVMAEKFGMPAGEAVLPELGGWWFRKPWFRSLFEGFLSNHRTLTRLGKNAVMEEAIRQALRFQDPQSGRLPVRYPDTKADLERFEQTGSLPPDYYQASDVGLLMFSWLVDYLPEVRDTVLIEALYQSFLKLYGTFRSETPRPRQGDPVLAENGLLMCVPSHSWMNGKRRISVEGLAVGDLPQRIDQSWQEAAVRQFHDGHTAWDRYQYPVTYLPEINAHWVRMLEVGSMLALRQQERDRHEEIIGVLKLAIGNYKKVFWNAGVGFLYNLITQDGRPDSMATAPGLEAVALLGTRVFTRREMEQAWQSVRASLLVTRRLGDRVVPFGLLAKDSQERIFFGDGQYHEAVCWPRVTPYLVTLLRELGEHELVSDLLAANLAHQMEEGVVFYHQEMLSQPVGGNASPGLRAGDPIPVKNPMQWGSQFCDAYLPQ